MKQQAVILILFLLAASCAQATMHLFNGSGTYDTGFIYPGCGGLIFNTSIFAGYNTSNLSDCYHPVLAKWEQFSFYLPLPTGIEFFGTHNIEAPAAKEFLREGWRPASASYDTPAIRQFALQDKYYSGIEEHDDPDRLELNSFLNDDEPPGRPLL